MPPPGSTPNSSSTLRIGAPRLRRRTVPAMSTTAMIASVTAVVAAPIYLLPIAFGAEPEAWAGRLEKLSASVIAALSVLLLFWALRHVTTESWALAIALTFLAFIA